MLGLMVISKVVSKWVKNSPGSRGSTRWWQSLESCPHSPFLVISNPILQGIRSDCLKYFKVFHIRADIIIADNKKIAHQSRKKFVKSGRFQ
jgi:hypothetical protein